MDQSLTDLLHELEGSVDSVRNTVEWIRGHHDVDLQFIDSHLKSTMREINYLQAQEIKPHGR